MAETKPNITCLFFCFSRQLCRQAYNYCVFKILNIQPTQIRLSGGVRWNKAKLEHPHQSELNEMKKKGTENNLIHNRFDSIFSSNLIEFAFGWRLFYPLYSQTNIPPAKQNKRYSSLYKNAKSRLKHLKRIEYLYSFSLCVFGCLTNENNQRKETEREWKRKEKRINTAPEKHKATAYDRVNESM